MNTPIKGQLEVGQYRMTPMKYRGATEDPVPGDPDKEIVFWRIDILQTTDCNQPLHIADIYNTKAAHKMFAALVRYEEPTQGSAPFDLEKAKAGKPLCDRLGNDLKFVAHVPERKTSDAMTVLVLETGNGETYWVNQSGTYTLGAISNHDVFLKTETRVAYAKVYYKLNGHIGIGELFTDKWQVPPPSLPIAKITWEEA